MAARRPAFSRPLPGPLSRPFSHAFSLVELLVVLGVIAVLAAGSETWVRS